MPRCDQCRFYNANPPATKYVGMYCIERQYYGCGECRRHPPTASREPTEGYFPFPVVFNDGWCGEFAPRHVAQIVSCGDGHTNRD